MKFRIIHAALLLGMAGPASPASATQPVKIVHSGPYSHASGAIFPEQMGIFSRSNIYRYDEAGTDMSASYQGRTPGGMMTITTYLYKVPAEAGDTKKAACDRDYEGASKAILDAYASARLLSNEEPPSITGAEPDLAHRSTYAFALQIGDQEQDVTSELRLYCFARDDWAVKYRATAPAGISIAPILDELIGTGPWPGKE